MESYKEIIEQKLALLPAKPGVYLMYNRNGVIIYVGKALVLKNRVRSYFRGKPSDRKTARLVKQIRNFDYIITATEDEALLLEANLIRKNKPKFNVMLKDDGDRPFIKVTVKQDFPKAVFSRGVQKDGSRYFGPYANYKVVKAALQTIEWLFMIRNCNLVIAAPFNNRPCIQYQLKKCSGPCAGFINKTDYAENVKNVIAFLNGNTKDIIKYLTDEMQKYSDNLNFEQAAVNRDKIELVKKINNSHSVYFSDTDNRDIIGIYTEENKAAVAVLKIINGKLLNKEIYPIVNIEDDTKEQLVSAFLSQYYSDEIHKIPNKIIVPVEPSDFLHLNTWLKNKIVVPQRGDNAKILMIAKENAFNYIETEKLKHLRKTARTILPVQELKEMLNLKKLPRKIACFDISTIQGTDTVSSGVFFENGKPKKKNYRRFIIKTVEGQNDFASMEETLTRFLNRIKTGDFVKPDLIVIDGGKGQLSSAYKMLCESGFDDIEMISLAKRLEEVYLPNHKEPITLKLTSPALKLLTSVRDEAHRFAITFHRKRRSSRTLVSELDKVKNIGEETKFLLLKHFGSVAKIKAAYPSQLMQVKGIGESKALAILEGLNNKSSETKK